MLKNLLSIYKKQQFNPAFTGVFINPFYFIRKGLYNGILKQSPRLNGKLLDFGCGSKPFKDLFNTSFYCGVDVIDKGHPHEKEPIDVYYDGGTLPFKDEQFDSVFSSEVFEHIPDLEKSLKEITRVLKNDAYALFTVPFVWDEHETPFDFFRYTRFGITRILQNNGFKIINISTTTTFLETISQLWILYLHHLVYTRNKYLNILINVLIISPFTILGICLSFLLPKLKDDLYHNSIILAQKKL